MLSSLGVDLQVGRCWADRRACVLHVCCLLYFSSGLHVIENPKCAAAYHTLPLSFAQARESLPELPLVAHEMHHGVPWTDFETSRRYSTVPKRVFAVGTKPRVGREKTFQKYAADFGLLPSSSRFCYCYSRWIFEDVCRRVPVECHAKPKVGSVLLR